MARSAMRLEPTGVIHRLLKGLAIGFVQYAVGSSEHFGALLLDTRAEAVDVAGDFDLLAQRQGFGVRPIQSSVSCSIFFNSLLTSSSISSLVFPSMLA
jgi:hypothetical protein